MSLCLSIMKAETFFSSFKRARNFPKRFSKVFLASPKKRQKRDDLINAFSNSINFYELDDSSGRRGAVMLLFSVRTRWTQSVNQTATFSIQFHWNANEIKLKSIKANWLDSIKSQSIWCRTLEVKQQNHKSLNKKFLLTNWCSTRRVANEKRFQVSFQPFIFREPNPPQSLGN